MIGSIKEPQPEAESVLSLDVVECSSVALSRQLFKASWHELKTVLRYIFGDHCDSQYQTLSIGSL